MASVVKDHPPGTFQPRRRMPDSTICSPLCQAKKTRCFLENSPLLTGWSRAGVPGTRGFRVMGWRACPERLSANGQSSSRSLRRRPGVPDALRVAGVEIRAQPNASRFMRMTKTAPTAARTSPTGLSISSARTTKTNPSANGTSSITPTPSCISRNIARATPPT
jgi:hypothetical protein